MNPNNWYINKHFPDNQVIVELTLQQQIAYEKMWRSKPFIIDNKRRNIIKY